MSLKIKNAGAYVDAVGLFVKKNGIYQSVVGLFVKQNGTYANALVPPTPVVSDYAVSTVAASAVGSYAI